MQESKQPDSLNLFEASFLSVQKARFGSIGCLLRARSVLQGHGVLALRHGPSTGAGQEQLQEQASKLEAGNAGKQDMKVSSYFPIN